MDNGQKKALMVPEILPPAIQEKVAAYKEQNYHIIYPVVTTNRSDITYALEVITVSPKPEDKQIYRMAFWAKDEYALTKQMLLRFALAAGITWKSSKRLDNYGNRDYVCFQTIACMTKPDGTLLEFPATKELDLLLEEEKLRDNYKRKGKPDVELENLVRRDMFQLRTHKLALCETKAMLRAIRGLLGLPSTMNIKQFEKPFVIPRLDLFHSLNPQQRYLQSQQGVNDLFGEEELPIGDNVPLPDNSHTEPEIPEFDIFSKQIEEANSLTQLNYQWAQIRKAETLTPEEGKKLGKLFGKKKETFTNKQG